MDKAIKFESLNKNHEKKKRSSEIKDLLKENSSKKTSKANQTTKKPIVNWEEEKEIIKKFLYQEYPLTYKKINKIIEEKKEKYIDIDKYQKFFLNYKLKNYQKILKNQKNSVKLLKMLKNILTPKQKKTPILQIKYPRIILKMMKKKRKMMMMMIMR